MTKEQERGYQGLEFSFAHFSRSIEHLKNISGRFLNEKSIDYVLVLWKNNLENFRKSGQQACQWNIPEDVPIRTRLSRGKYQRDGRGGFNVFAKISCTWEIRKLDQRNFLLNGNASTRVQIYSKCNRTIKLLSQWTVDVGDSQSPGCHFHTQFKPLKRTSTSSFDIPRLPSMIVTPMDVVEFVLGELFQEEWLSYSRQRTSMPEWGKSQASRFKSYLNWHLSEIEDGGTPWTIFKDIKPHRAIFGDCR